MWNAKERRKHVAQQDVADGNLDVHVFATARTLGAHSFMGDLVASHAGVQTDDNPKGQQRGP